MNAATNKVICVGHSALDRVFTVTAWPQASAKVRASRYEEIGGGMAANAAVAIARLGGEAHFWGPAGEDAVADVMEAQLTAAGVDTAKLHRIAGRRSSTSAILIDARGERLVVSYRGTALEAPAEWLPLDELASAGAVLADVRWPEGALRALKSARSKGVVSVLDADSADASTLHALAGAAEYAVFSADGLAGFAGDVDIAAGLRRALELGARMAAVTQGEHGVIWLEAGGAAKPRHMPAFATQVVDTLAAGDVFHGAFALELARGGRPADALRFASAAAAIKCSRAGGRDGSPTYAEVDALLRAAATSAPGSRA